MVTLRSIPPPSQPSWTLRLDLPGALSGTLLGTQRQHSLPFFFAALVRTQLLGGLLGSCRRLGSAPPAAEAHSDVPCRGGRAEGVIAPGRWALSPLTLTLLGSAHSV